MYQIKLCKYELMLNDTCVWGCPKYKEHFEAINNQNKLGSWSTLGQEHCLKVEECCNENLFLIKPIDKTYPQLLYKFVDFDCELSFKDDGKLSRLE